MARRIAATIGSFALIGMGLSLGAAEAQAAALIGTLGGNECGGAGGFPNCYAYPNGTTSQGQTGGGSPTIFKYNSGGTTEINSTLFPSITGSEFTVNYAGATNSLSFAYNPGAGDPVIHYFAIFQAGTAKLFYDVAAITADNISLSTYFPTNPGFSHITFFDTGGVIDPHVGGVPEPSTWIMMLLGVGVIGYAMRRKQRQTVRVNFA